MCLIAFSLPPTSFIPSIAINSISYSKRFKIPLNIVKGTFFVQGDWWIYFLEPSLSCTCYKFLLKLQGLFLNLELTLPK